MGAKPPERRPSSRDDRRVSEFLARAAPIITAYHGLTPGCQRALTDVARHLGLSDEQMKQALRSVHNTGEGGEKVPRGNSAAPDLHRPERPPQPPEHGPAEPAAVKSPRVPDQQLSTQTSPQPPPVPAKARQDWQGQAVPTPPPPPEPPPTPPPQAPPGKPQDAFYADLRRAFGKVRGRTITVKAEQKLVRLGQQKHGLAEVFVRHLLEDVAAEHEVRVPSQIQVEQLAAREAKKEPSDPASDANLNVFLKRVAPIIAQQRGINVQSRVRMGAVARELGLSDAEMERALKSLQGGDGGNGDPRLLERRKAYREFLAAALANISRGIITSAEERTLLVAGTDQYGVDEPFVRETIQEEAAERGIRFISDRQATDHVARLLDEQMGFSQRITPGLRRKLYAEGTQWGLTHEQVDAVVKQKYSDAYQQAQRERRHRMILLGGVGVVLAALVGVPAAVLLVGRPPPAGNGQSMASTDGIDGNKDGANGAGQEKLPLRKIQDWWDADLTQDIVRAAVHLPTCADALEQIRSPDPADRGWAYEELARLAPTGPYEDGSDDAVKLLLMKGVLIGCYARDPADEAIVRLRNALLAQIPPSHGRLPDHCAVYDKAFWAMDVAADALGRDDLADKRAAAMVAAISRAIDTSLDPTATMPDIARQCLAGLATHLYHTLISGAAAQPNLVLGLHTALTVRADEYLDTKIHESLDTDLLVAVLPAIQDAWREYEDLIQRCVRSKDPLNVLKLVGVLERTTDADLQRYLAEPLRRRAGGIDDARSVPEIARAVRMRLGATMPAADLTAEQRWNTFKTQAEDVLAHLTATSDEPEKLLEEVVRLEYACTLGAALAQKELGSATFDQLHRDPPRRSSASSSPSTTTRPVASPAARPPASAAASRRTSAAKSAGVLSNYRRFTATQRLMALRNLASVAGRIPHLRPEHGAAIAGYLLAVKNEQEHKAVVPNVTAVTRWKSVRLALADQLPQTRFRRPFVQEILSKTFGRDIDLGEDDRWRQQMRVRLLEDVFRELALSERRKDVPRSLDVSSERLHEYLCTQARLLGVAPARYKATRTPAHVLGLIVDQYAAGLGGNLPRPADRGFVDGLPHELAVAEYLGTDDLRRTMLLQRIWLRLLGIGVARKHPDRAAAADRLVGELGRYDARATHLLPQLREAAKNTLQMWLLMNRPS